ncbi:hypothetical protein QR680_017481 [Steinernema hermaphroditum]|uniref:DH domain-containing protein n=1 Tax=Steinernema hermaphroditum TaxID=289476 RepID=A0AA39HGS2_9BILA|nr:hypothetical protein QR680_017481 [Steinernema hermaphroditum]
MKSFRIPVETRIVAGSSSCANPFFDGGIMADAVGTSEAPPNPPKSLWDSGLGRSLQPSCYGSLVASTSSCSSAFEFSQRMQKSESGCGFAEAPKFQYDVADDLRSLKERLRCAALFDSTVSAAASEMQSVLERSANANYGTGWMLAEEMSEASSDDDSWDGYMEVGDKRLKVREMADVLASRFAFISGLRTHEGYSIVTFPDSHCQVSFDDYHLLITYLLKVPPLEETHKGYVLIIDRRMDKWSSVRTLFQFITSFFPDPLRVVFLLKPEGVLQRALEVGYRSFVDNFKYKVIVCQNSLELRHFVAADRLTMDVGGLLKYNHLEWVQHRMDIERMKSSAAVIAESLSEFGRCLKETELPNDVETTERILEVQTAEHDAIKEDFRISIRKGLSLLRQVRQFETKPEHEQLSPTRLHNVTAIERMLVQLEDTERSFDVFWTKHLHKLTQCLQLRRFEDSFRKLQTDFTRHLLYLEEHREVGDGVERVEALTESHREYTAAAMEDVAAARALKDAGDELLSTKDTEIAGSLVPKCSELGRMADALASALDRRAQVLRLSENMHRQIAEANQWCKRGVDLLSATPFEMNQSTASSALSRIEGFIADGDSLQLDALKGKSDANNLILLTTTETSTLLAQVAERIDDIRRMSAARRDALQKFALQEKEKPVQVVSPEKTQVERGKGERSEGNFPGATTSVRKRHFWSLVPPLAPRRVRRRAVPPARLSRATRSFFSLDVVAMVAVVGRILPMGPRKPKQDVPGVRASSNLIIKRRLRSALAAAMTRNSHAASGSQNSASSQPATIASSFGAEMKRRLPRLLSFRSSKRRPLLAADGELQKGRQGDVAEEEDFGAPLIRFRSMRLPLSVVSSNEAVDKKPSPRSVDTSPSKSSPGSSARHLVDVALVHGHRSASALCSSASSGEVASTACSRSHSVSSPIDSPSNERASTIANFVLAELLTTEQTYVRELQSLVEYYVNPFEAPENQHLISPAIRGRSDLVFGNLRELYEFHNKFLLKEIVKSSDCVLDICHCLVSQRNRFLGLYLPYCQNKSVSEVLRREHVDGTKFFLECQKRAGHPLPLSAYLLKPIQRITKYQLLLKELAAHCSEDIRRDVQSSLDSMLHLLSTLNGAMNQLHISGYAGDLSLLGPLRLQTECEVYAFKKKTHRLNKAQRRHLFLFEGGILFCKQRTQPVPYAPEYYEHKISIVMRNLGFAECSKACPDRFEIWDVNKTDGYAVFALDERARQKWIQKLSRMTARLPVPLAAQGPPERNRPQSWTSTVSSDSNTSRSSIDEFAPSSTSIQTFTTTSSKTDANGNDRADEKGSALDGDSEDLADRLDNNSAHVTTIQIPLSKSLQNCEIADSLEASAIEAVNQPSQLLAQ